MIGRLDKQKVTKGTLSSFESFLEDKYQTELAEIDKRKSRSLARINAKEIASKSQKILADPLDFSDFGLGEPSILCNGKSQYWREKPLRIQNTSQNFSITHSKAMRNNISSTHDLSQSLNVSGTHKPPISTRSRVLSKKKLLDISENNDYHLGSNSQRFKSPSSTNLKEKEGSSREKRQKTKTTKATDISERLIQDILKDDENDDIDIYNSQNILKSLDAIKDQVSALPDAPSKNLTKDVSQDTIQIVPTLPLLTPRVTSQNIVSPRGLLSARNLDIGVKKTGTGPRHIPGWLKHKPQFLSSLKDSLTYESLKISMILSKLSRERDEHEKRFLLDYLASIKLFHGFSQKQLNELTNCIYLIKLNRGDVLCRKNDPATCLWIVIEGEIVIYKDEAKSKSFTESEILGREALTPYKVRPETLEVASPEASVMVLSAFHYNRLMVDTEEDDMTQAAISNFLRSLPCFKKIKGLKFHELSTMMAAKRIAKNEVIYQRGDDSNELYILRKGKVEQEVTLHMEKTNRWPTSLGKYDERKIVKKVKLRIPLSSGEIFGLKEMELQTRREDKVVVVEEAIVYYITRDAIEQSSL